VLDLKMPDLQRSLGLHVRKLRNERGWSRRELAGRTQLSERFLALVEAGEGNPSIASLEQIARALDVAAASLLAIPSRSSVIALLGLRGAGKSAVGRALAKRLRVDFVELDSRIEEAAGLSLREIFELHGEEHYRRMEREALEALLANDGRVVLATGGGIVAHRDTFELLRRSATTVWLKATPEEHWSRVLAQGDHRPMANDPLAMARLRALLAEREPLYRMSHHIADTSGRSVESIVKQLSAISAVK
jgi:XRE family transcriptional regulator, aerobic/anaerobic benzoate catabolism transcriptional regulator